MARSTRVAKIANTFANYLAAFAPARQKYKLEISLKCAAEGVYLVIKMRFCNQWSRQSRLGGISLAGMASRF